MERFKKIPADRVPGRGGSWATPRKSKYNAQRTGGHASQKEHRRALILRMLERAGKISGLREQVRFELIPAQRGADGRLNERSCEYVADFVYRNSRGEMVVEDSKGVCTDVYKIKRKLMLWRHGIKIIET